MVVFAVLAVIGLLGYIRLAPSDPEVWHIDPGTVPVPAGSGWLLRTGEGNAPAHSISVESVEALRMLDAIAMATPRTTRLAGSPETSRVTYVTRSLIMGFPDYTTVMAVPTAAGTDLVIYARQRFGSNDHGVNKARVESWVSQLGRPAS
jgi:hypothetical protein